MVCPARTLAALLLIGCMGSLGAQEPRHLGSNRGHTLGGHVFQPSSEFPDPFVTTYLTSQVGAGAAPNLEVPVYNAEDSVVRVLKGDVGFLTMGVRYQQRVLPWLALQVNMGGLGRFGTETPSLLSEGVSATYNFGAGAMARVWGTEKLYVSVAVDYSSTHLSSVTPLEYVQGVAHAVGKVLDSLQAIGGIALDTAVIDSVIRSIDLTGYSLHNSSKAQNATLGVRAAFAPLPWLGLTGLVQTGLVGLFNGPSDAGLLDVGAAADVDFEPLWRVPVGVKVSGRWQSVDQDASDLVSSRTQFGANVAYTGREDFSIALELLFSSLEQRRTDARVSGRSFLISMRYYF